MLKSNSRYILYFDLVMAPYPADGPQLPLADFIPGLEKRAKEGASVQIIDKDRRALRLYEIKRVKTKSGKPAAAMLFGLGDRDKAESGLTDFITGKVRIPRRTKNEVGGLSVHAVVGLSPTQPKGHLYRMVYEDVSGLGRTLIQGFLRSEFHVISNELGLTFEREGGREIKTRPMVEINAHASDKLKNSIKQGRLLHVELIDYVEKDLGFDEQKHISSIRRDMSLFVSKTLPQGESLDFLGKLKAYATKHGYESMRVRWREDDREKPRSAKVDVARQDAGEAFFTKSAEVKLTKALPEISETMSTELVGKMTDLLE